MSNKTSDKNVAKEEITNNKNKYAYIKKVAERIVNEYRERYKDEKFYPEPSEQTDMAYKILSLLAEREQDKVRIKKLEKEKKQLIEKREINYDLYKAIIAIMLRENRKCIEIDFRDVLAADDYELTFYDNPFKTTKEIKLIRRTSNDK